jgi:ferredoxin
MQGLCPLSTRRLFSSGSFRPLSALRLQPKMCIILGDRSAYSISRLWKGVIEMAFIITDECISCGACESECPVNAISEGTDIYVINPSKCVECVGYFDEQQCASVCPVDACQPDPAHPRK